MEGVQEFIWKFQLQRVGGVKSREARFYTLRAQSALGGGRDVRSPWLRVALFGNGTGCLEEDGREKDDQ